MPSQPLETGWDFRPVLDLIDSDVRITSPPQSPAVLARATSQDTASCQGGVSLGNFGKLFEQLGFTSNEQLPLGSPLEPVSLEEPSSADEPTTLDPQLESPLDFETVEAYQPRPVTLADFLPPTAETPATESVPALTKKERRAARTRVATEQKTSPEDAPQVFSKPANPSKPPTHKSATSISKSTPAHQDIISKPTRAQSRSNVSAKIRPATPVRIPSPQKDRKVLQEQAIKSPTKPVASIAAAPLQDPKTSRPALAATPKPIFSAAVKSTHDSAEDAVKAVSASDPKHIQDTKPVTPRPVAAQSALPSRGYFTPQPQSSGAPTSGLIPRTVQPVVVQRSVQPVVTPRSACTPAIATATVPSLGSFTLRPKVDRNYHFFNKLCAEFPEDMPWLVSPMQMCNDRPSKEGLHIFVDASNIMIGFRDQLRRCGVQQFELSFDSFALLLERRRPVAKRVFAGSHREANPLPHVARLIETSKAVGYENNVQEQVFITREDSERKKFFKDVDRMGWHKATQQRRAGAGGGGSGSDSENGLAAAAPSTPSAPRWVEQGVDEILHLKMCQSIIDAEEPSTMVLATGDGAEAEMSDGFLAHVERALKRGWNVELVSWKTQINGGYRNRRFRQRWGDAFRIVELDGWLESLIQEG